MRHLLGVCLLALLVSTPALADKYQARAHFRKGMAAYMLDHFEQAISEFELGFAEEPEAAFLYNLAQSQARLGHMQQAINCYRKYIDMGAPPDDVAMVQKRIEELEALVTHPQPAARPLPDSTPLPAPPPPVAKPVPDSAPIAFPGDVPTTARLIDGPVSDLNVMTRLGRFQSRMQRFTVKGSLVVPTRAATAVLVALANLSVAHHGKKFSLSQYDALMWDATECTDLHIMVPTAEVYLIEIASPGTRPIDVA